LYEQPSQLAQHHGLAELGRQLGQGLVQQFARGPLAAGGVSGLNESSVPLQRLVE